MRYIIIKRKDGTIAIAGKFETFILALEQIKEHGTFTAYRTCPFDGHLIRIGEFNI